MITKEQLNRLLSVTAVYSAFAQIYQTASEWICPSCGVEHSRDHNAAINLRNDAISKIKSTVGTIGSYACGGQGSRTKTFGNVDCSLKQEGIIVRYSTEAHRL